MELETDNSESHKLELRAVNFDNALEVDSALELVSKNLASEFNSNSNHSDY